MSPKQRFNITLEPEQIQLLRILERATGASASEHIRRAVTAYIREQTLLHGPEVAAELERRRTLALKKRLRAR